MSDLDQLRHAASELARREERVEQARADRDALIIGVALETAITYTEIAEATGLTISAVWKITSRAGISRQRVQRLPSAASG